MRLYIIAKTDFKMTASILWDSVKALAIQLTAQPSFELFIVGDHLPASFVSFCNDMEAITLMTTNESHPILKTDQSPSIIHFGADFKANASAKKYFIPLGLSTDYMGDAAWLQRLLIKRRFTKWMDDAHKVICINDWSFKSISERYIKYASKIKNSFLPINSVPNFEWYELTTTKEKLTLGNQYFLCFAPLERFTPILKEFSIFKKWQQTTMYFVFVVETIQAKELALSTLKGYKHRQSIAILTYDELQLLQLAASYVILLEGVSFSKSIWIQQAIQYEVPILFDPSTGLPDAWLKAGEVFSFSEIAALSNHFKLYYKDELYRIDRAKMSKEWLTALYQNQLQNDSNAIHNILQNNP